MAASTSLVPSPSSAGVIAFPNGVTLRRVASLAEYQECVAIQEETWGDDFRERVPAAILMVSQKLGGVCAAAFAPDGKMLGFVFGLTGPKDGTIAHWSDLLAVRTEARGAHVGERLKHFQRELAHATGATVMYWTFDPLVARNAHLNLVRLGARVAEYKVNMYGNNTGSPLHGALDTDRIVARWDLTVNRPASEDPPARAGGEFAVRPAEGDNIPAASDLPDAAVIRIAVPLDVESLPHESRVAWRTATRRAFTHYLNRGYHVAGFQRARHGQPPFYELAR